MLFKNHALTDLDGTVIKQGTEVATVAKALINAALSNPPQGVKRETKEIMERYQASVELNKVLQDQAFELEFSLVAMLRDDLVRVYPVWMAGQVLSIIDPPKPRVVVTTPDGGSHG